MSDLLEQVRDHARSAQGIAELEGETASVYLQEWWRDYQEGLFWAGRFIPCRRDQLLELLGDLLAGHLSDLFLLSCRKPVEKDAPERRGANLGIPRVSEDVITEVTALSHLVLRGHGDLLVELIEAFPDLDFLILNRRRTWSIARFGSTYLRVQGAIWTRYFPWATVRKSCLLAVVVFGINSWLVQGAPFTIGLVLMLSGPAILVGLSSFVSLKNQGPGQSPSKRSWIAIFVVVIAAMVVALQLAFLLAVSGF